ncbi:MAG TPA: DUF5996 family protein [Burkholderiales bacterium]|nr:DUF5996 family protein [Burkholderiales bacterium]
MSAVSATERDAAWPALPLDAWAETYHTLHMWLQIVGKIRLGLTPLLNHWWNSTLYVTSRGLTTSPIPWGGGAFELRFDFIAHRLELLTSSGRVKELALRAQPVCAFYAELMSALESEGIALTINTKPQEVADPIRFEDDDVHRSYDPEYVHRMWRILLSTKQVFEEFRARFIGKASPVHFFWGSLDLAYTRFSGRRAPPRNGVISAEAYSHECSSVGWWPGSGDVTGPAFYSYTVPEPAGFAASRVLPARAFYQPTLHEFVLMYDDVRVAAAPAQDLLAFCQSAYSAGAELAGWDRKSLER